MKLIFSIIFLASFSLCANAQSDKESAPLCGELQGEPTYSQIDFERTTLGGEELNVSTTVNGNSIKVEGSFKAYNKDKESVNFVLSEGKLFDELKAGLCGSKLAFGLDERAFIPIMWSTLEQTARLHFDPKLNFGDANREKTSDPITVYYPKFTSSKINEVPVDLLLEVLEEVRKRSEI